ncbi:MAG TPA: DinB family protein [Bryobacteraceae bacterium]|jgi:uncharacterized damage-inducible protein DinB|nr:DinB family protein [Bryobacteraceae bacterium]
MDPLPSGVFLDFSIRKLEQLGSRIRECVARLSDEQIWARHGEHENAVGNLVLHLAGNVGQWIVAGIGGRPDTRARDEEFNARGQVTGAELMARLDGVVAEAVAVLKGVTPERLAETYQPQKYRVTVLEGIYHVVEHFSQHTGQIMFATKLLTGRELGFYKHLSRPVHGEQTP